MNIASAIVVFLLTLVVALPSHAVGMKLKPCEKKKMFDAMAIPPTTGVALVAGHEFRKADICVPIEVRAQWTDHYKSFDHNLYDVNAIEAYPGEFWYRTDREEFVIVAGGKTFSGGDKLRMLSASGEACNHNSDEVCDTWTAFGNADVRAFPIYESKTGAFVYAYPTVLTKDETVPVFVNVMPPHFEFYRNKDHYFRPPMVEVENLSLLDNDPFRYTNLINAARKKLPVTKLLSWDHNEKKDGEPSHHTGTLMLQIVFDPVCPKSLDVIAPVSGQRYVFSSASPGVLKIEAEAGNFVDVSPEDEKEITWSAPEKEGAELVFDPPTKKGKRMTIIYRGLPKDNAAFGPTPISASLDVGGACDAVGSEVTPQLFFSRDATNNPGGSEPNWFYYWSQTPARVGPAKYGALAAQCSAPATNARDGIIGYYRYIHRDPHYFICNLGRLPGDFTFTAVTIKTRNPLQIGDVTTTGIDTFAIASHHENGHYQHFKDWWFQFNPNPIRPSGDHMMQSYDFDGDFIPDAEETARSLDPHDKYTLKQYDSSIDVDDEEYITWLAEGEWVVGSADNADWAKPGKQWQ
jgi:hypothetical protein